MPGYDLRFLKIVCDDTGHDRLVCQWQLQVEAPDAETAARLGEAEFCRRHRSADWTLHADTLEVVALQPAGPAGSCAER